MILNEATNSDIVDRFIDNDWPKRGTISSKNRTLQRKENGWVLISYSTPIAYIPDANPRTVIVNEHSYSQTTSQLQGEILRSARGSGYEIIKVSEDGIHNAMWKGITPSIFDDIDIEELCHSAFRIIFSRKKYISFDLVEHIVDKYNMIKKVQGLK